MAASRLAHKVCRWTLCCPQRTTHAVSLCVSGSSRIRIPAHELWPTLVMWRPIGRHRLVWTLTRFIKSLLMTNFPAPESAGQPTQSVSDGLDRPSCLQVRRNKRIHIYRGCSRAKIFGANYLANLTVEAIWPISPHEPFAMVMNTSSMVRKFGRVGPNTRLLES